VNGVVGVVVLVPADAIEAKEIPDGIRSVGAGDAVFGGTEGAAKTEVLVPETLAQV